LAGAPWSCANAGSGATAIVAARRTAIRQRRALENLNAIAKV